MVYQLSIVVVALVCTTTLAAQVASQGTRTRSTTGISIPAAAPTGDAILQKLPTVAAPTNLRASGTTQAISLAWNAAAGATGYRIWRTPVGGVESMLTPSPITATSFQDAGPFAPYDHYRYRVAAVHATGESMAALVTFSPPPPAPPPVSITNDYASTQTAATACTFAHTVHWAPVPGAAEYILTKTQKGNFIRLINWVKTIQYEERPTQIRLPATQRSYAATTVLVYPQHKYDYTLVAVFQPGNLMSLPSTSVTFNPPPGTAVQCT
jgi:hypothetical protein